MRIIVLDSNAIIMHGRSFPERVRSAVEDGKTLVVPHSVKRELVDDVLENESASPNHRSSAQTIQELIDDGFLVLHTPDFDRYSGVIDEARRRISDPSLPEHEVKADQYIPAIVIKAAQDDTVTLVTADRKLRSTVRDIADRKGVGDHVYLRDPLTVL
jgi:rRNA-processing protein FCF1